MPNIAELYPSRFLTATDLKGREVTARIETVEVEEFESDGRKRGKPVLYFEGVNKGLVLNKTNALTVADICGSQETADWIGTQLTLFTAMVAFQGRHGPAIRIRASAQPAAIQMPAAAVLSDEIPF